MKFNLRQTFTIFFQKKRILHALITATLFILHSGCQPETLDQKGAGTVNTGSVENLSLKIADWRFVEQLVADNQGKIVVVDLWSTSCPPCLREFPELVALQKLYPKEVLCVSFNCDYFGGKNYPPEYYRKPVEKFLAEQKASMTNIISNVPAEELFPTLDLASMPATYVYDRQGKLAKRFDNERREYGKEGYTYKRDVIPLVESLLKTDTLKQ
ncbi:TlpA disulfide reductase family protein [Gimesia algae]|uniref:Thiol-disulfide oxidoreductase n=1 Tax=Gimesia algae TaxID=2527971 RepID=A0A517VK20_9PLAN|nr:TlpA disulfide reductase family protein [Gimesia algae]QDT93371.1 thiol-disulfide oxidoreductase [Gimesia algae]